MKTDEEIKRDVIESLFWDNRVDASDVTVEIDSGLVELGGSVPTYRSRFAAEEDARVIAGVIDVRNDVVVRYPTTTTVPSDEEIRVDIRDTLAFDPDIAAADVDLEVDAGWVTIRGSVPNVWQKDLVSDVVARSRGVIGFDNELAVVPTQSIADESIARDIVGELERRIDVDPTDIDVTVVDGNVTLLGTVPSWRARESVYQAATYTAGVVDVVENLTVSAV